MKTTRWLIALSAATLFLWGCGDDDPASPNGGGNGNTETSVSIPASADNTLYEDPDTSLSNGKGQWMFAGLTRQESSRNTRRALIRFNVTDSIPAGATIQSATLRLNMDKTESGASSVSIHRVLTEWGEGSVDAGFNEGTGDTVETDTDDATWLHSRYDSEFWTTPGGDFTGPASATTTVSGAAVYQWTGATLVADVQDWLDDPGHNFGWIVIGDETAAPSAKRFATRENPIPATRPKLMVTYKK